MDIDITEEQELLREMSARFIEDGCPLAAVRALAEDERGVSTDYLKQTAELGWYALLVDEAHGGGQVSESGVSDAAVVAGERGRLVQPGPFVPTNLVALAVSERVTIMDLRESMCRWPLGDPTTPEFRFCGARSITGLPYCTHHAEIAYQPAAERKRDRRVASFR
jgi:hypothetical protein